MIAEAAFTVMFYFLAIASIVFALCVVMSRRLLRAAIALMMTLTMSAGLYLLLEAEFLAGVQILVYVGGIVVLIVFAVMLTRAGDLIEERPTFSRKVIGGLSSGLLALVTCVVLCEEAGQGLSQYEIPEVFPSAPANETHEIGRLLLDFGQSGYVLPFEVISLLLLSAVIAGIVIARRTPPTGQPITSGGDLPSEVDFHPPSSQRDAILIQGEPK